MSTPSHSIPTSTLLAGKQSGAQLRGRRFVWLLSPPWDNVWTRQNHFAIRLARLGAEVLYVENPIAWSSALRQRSWRNLPGPTPTREVIPGIHVMKAALSLPGSKRSNPIATLNGWLLGAQIQRWLTRRGWDEYTCWCRVPHSVFALSRLQPRQVVYDITDDYELYESAGKFRQLVRSREERLLAKADFVAITTRELESKETLQQIPTCLIPNGVDYDLFAPASEPGMLDPLVAKVKKPVICYVGLTSHWMDFELLEQLARRWPGHILMLGPIAAPVEERARAIPGLVWGGLIPQPQLAPYLRGVDLFIMPHLVNELRKKANPLKICEYLATGKPFVSVDLPALDPVRHLVDIARDRSHFVELVERRLEKPEPGRAAASQAYARTRSWDTIFEQLLAQFRWQTSSLT